MLIDQLFPNDVVTESAYGAVAGVETIRQLIQSVKNSQDIDLKVGPEQFPVRYDEARYLLSLWKANKDGGDKTAELFGNVNWIQDKLEDRDYRMGPGKLKDIDQERAKEIQKDRVLDLESKERTDEILPAIAGALGRAAVGALASTAVDSIKKRLSDTDIDESDCECGVDKEKETEFHKKLDDLVHATFGKRVEEGVEDIKPTDEEERQLLNMLRVFFDDQEGYQDAVAIDAVEYLVKKGLLKDFANSLPYFDMDYEEFLDSYDKDFLEKRFGITEDSVNEGYKGWTYDAEIIDYDDNRKISHSATKDGKEVSMDWSPYSTPSEEDFALWVDLGMPDRKAVNGIGPLDIDDLIQLAKDKPEVTHSLLVKEDDKDPVDQSKLDAKTKVALKKAGLKYGAQTKGDPLASLVTFVADKDSEKTQDIDRLDQENDQEEKDIATQAQVDKKHDTAIGNNSLKDRYQDQEIEKLKQDLQKLLAR